MLNLYQINEFRKAALWPAHLMSQTSDAFLGSLPDDLFPGKGILNAANEMLLRSTKTYSKPSFGIDAIQIDGKNIFITEEIVSRRPFCDLLHFSRSIDGQVYGKDAPIVLVVAPLSGHFATLLRDTVRTLLLDFDVYITDWCDGKYVSNSHGYFSLEDYVSYIMDFTKFLGREIHLLAVCQPAVPVLAAVSVMAETKSPQPKSMILMGGPIDARVNPGKVNEFATAHSIEWIRQNLVYAVPSYYPGYGRLVCPGFLMLNGFMSLNPERHQSACWNMFDHLVRGDEEEAETHRKFYDEYRAVMDIPGEYFIESVESVFKAYRLPLGTFTWHDNLVRPEAISQTALFTIEGELDDISCVGQTQAAQDLCTQIPQEKRAHYVQLGVGHYGIFNGKKWRGQIYPRIKEFIHKNR